MINAHESGSNSPGAEAFIRHVTKTKSQASNVINMVTFSRDVTKTKSQASDIINMVKSSVFTVKNMLLFFWCVCFLCLFFFFLGGGGGVISTSIVLSVHICYRQQLILGDVLCMNDQA